MRADELTQKFKLKGEICPKSDTSKRWRILDTYSTSCYIKEVGGGDFKIIDYDVLDRDWTPYKRTSKKVIPTFVMDNFNNVVRVGDAVYYVCGRGINGRIHEIKMGVVTGFTEKKVVLDTGAYIDPDKMGKIGVSVSKYAIDKCI